MQIKLNKNCETEIYFSWREIWTLLIRKKLILSVPILDAFTMALIHKRTEIAQIQKKDK